MGNGPLRITGSMPAPSPLLESAIPLRSPSAPRAIRRGAATKAEATACVALALTIIHQEFPETVSMGALSASVGLGPFALWRTFRAVTGMSVREYVMNRRVSHARELLRATRYSITEVAQLAGFGDLPRFDKVFRQRTGMSPRDYRRGAGDREKTQENY